MLLHISTAYVAGRRTGRIAEAALPDIAAAEIAVVDDLTRAILEDGERGNADARETRSRLVDAGMTRARSLGWHDTYTYTKALGEMVLAAHRGTVPTAIFRPTIIESSLRDPMAGWIENLNVCDPMIVEYGRGRLPDFPLRRETVLDVIPVDLVANALVALLPLRARHADDRLLHGRDRRGEPAHRRGACTISGPSISAGTRCSIGKDGPFPCPTGRSRHRSAFARCSPTRPGA